MNAQESLQKIQTYKQRGLLVRVDKVELEKLRAALHKENRHAAIQAALQVVVREAYEYQLQPDHPDLVTERSRISALIKQTPYYGILRNMWNEQAYHSLVDTFVDQCPESFIKEVINFDEVFVERPLAHPDTTLSSEDFVEMEQSVRTAIKEIPAGLDYEVRIFDAIKRNSRGHKAFLIARCNTIADLFNAANPDNIPVLNEEIGRQFHTGFRLFHTAEALATKRYSSWYNLTALMCNAQPISFPIFKATFPAPMLDSEEFSFEISGVIKLSGAILANFYEVMPDHIAQDLILPVIYGLLKELPVEQDTLDFTVRKWLWGVGYKMATGEWSLPTFVAEKFSWWRHVVEDHILPLGFVTALTSLLSTIGIAIYNALDRLGELIFLTLNSLFQDSYETITEYFYLNRLFLSALLPEQRRRPKAVWALLFTNDFVKLTPGEKFMMGCELMKEPKPVVDYSAWAEQRLQAMADLGVDLITEPAIPIRDFRIPTTPFVPDEETADIAPLMPDGRHINQVASDFTKKLLSLGVPRGMDGLWFSTDDRIAKSIQRYSTEIPPVEDIIETITLRAAHALADKYPMMYRNAQVLTPRAAMNKIKLNDYSPALPYIPRFRTRRDIARVGIWEATIKEAERLLRIGEHPGECAHCFVKSQVVKLQKLIEEDTALRTVTASSLLSNVIQYVSTVEITRRQPPLDAFVMNAVPRSEGGFRPFYEELSKYAHVFAADVTKFDSQLIPTVTDALIELRTIGYDGSLIRNVAASQIKASYIAMRFAKLVDLRTGQTFDKIKGLLTGQGNTSVDNRDAFRILIIAAWSLVTGRDPSLFWDTNVIGNAGDDDAIGTDEPEIWPKVMDTIQNRFGMKVRVETEGFGELNLVGLRVGEVPPHSIKYYTIFGHPVPNFSIMADAKALLHKRTDWTMNISNSGSDIKFLMKHLDGIIGSAYQTAHLIDVYELLGEQYVKETQQILLRFYEKVVVEVTRDEENKPIEYFIHLGSERERYKSKTSNVRQWLKSHRYPKYADVMRIWLKPQDINNTKMAKDHRKLLTWNPVVPYQEQMLYGVLDLRRKMYDWVPNHVARALPEFRGIDPTFGMRNPDYVIEKFVWLSLYQKNNKVPAAALFRTRLRENPYGSACDPTGFLSWLTDDKNLDDLVSTDLEGLRAQMVFVTLAYWFVENCFKIFKDVPLLAIVYHLYAFSTRDINRLYAALNYVHMIATGASSSIISNMMPPDPYAWMKRFSVVMTYLLPRRWYHALLPGIKHVVQVLPLMVELWAAGDALVGPRPFRSVYSQLDVPTNWSIIAAQLKPLLQDQTNRETILVVAPTGTGKSTGFIASLLYNVEIVGTVWLFCPTIASRDIYENDFLPNDYFQILTSGVVNRAEQRVKVLTYGHARNRLPNEAGPSDILIFDEVHKGEMDIMSAWFKFADYKRIMITATETAFMPTPDHRFTYPGEKRFKVESQIVNFEFPTLVEEILKMDPSLMERALIMCPDYNTTQDIIQTLSRLSINCSALSSYEPIPVSTGCIAATTIADQALTIQPPPTCLIDLGLTLKIDHDFSGFMPASTARQVPTSAETATQRLGRVGRAGNSRAFVMACAGTGDPERPKLTPFGLLDDETLMSELLGWYQVNLLVEPINDHKNIFRFFSVMPDIAIGHLSPHTIATCFYILARHSDMQFGENLWLEWLDLRVSRSQHEILNIVIDHVLDLGFGDPLLGDWTHAMALVASGAFGVKINNRMVEASCLCIVNQTIVKCGAHKDDFVRLLPSLKSYVGLLPAQPAYWKEFNSILTFSPLVNLVHNRLEIKDLHIHSLSSTNSLNNLQELYHDVQVAAFISNVRALAVPRAKPNGQTTCRIFINDSPIHVAENSHIVVNTIQAQQLLAVDIIDVPGYGLGDTALDLGLVLHVACAQHDNTSVIYGDVPPALITLSKSFPHLGLVVDPAKSWMIISPRYARAFAHALQLHRRRGDEDAYFNAIPKRVLLGSALEQYNGLKSEIRVYLNADGHLAGLV